jgi:hypothetical protein
VNIRNIAMFAVTVGVLSGCGIFDGKDDEPKPYSGDDDGDDGGDGADGTDGTDTGDGTNADSRTVSGHALCAGGGIATSGDHTAVTCIAPADFATGAVATDGTHTLQPGPIFRVAP